MRKIHATRALVNPIFRGKQAITTWHKTCVHLWQYAMAMDVAAAKLRPHELGRITQTNK
jgi:hypothetical protein